MATHIYIASFFNKKAFFFSRKNKNYSKLISDSESTYTKCKGNVMINTFRNFANTFIYLKIFVNISPKRSSILFVKNYSLTPKFSYGEMINKQKLMKYSLIEVKLFTHQLLLTTKNSLLFTFYLLLITFYSLQMYFCFFQRHPLKFP